MPISQMAHSTDLRACLRRRARCRTACSTCGRPAVPSTSASDSEMKSILVVVVLPYCRPGLEQLARRLGELSTAAPEQRRRG